MPPKKTRNKKRNATSPALDQRPQPRQPDPQELSTAQLGAGTHSPPPNNQPGPILSGTFDQTIGTSSGGTPVTIRIPSDSSDIYILDNMTENIKNWSVETTEGI